MGCYCRLRTHRASQAPPGGGSREERRLQDSLVVKEAGSQPGKGAQGPRISISPVQLSQPQVQHPTKEPLVLLPSPRPIPASPLHNSWELPALGATGSLALSPPSMANSRSHLLFFLSSTLSFQRCVLHSPSLSKIQSNSWLAIHFSHCFFIYLIPSQAQHLDGFLHVLFHSYLCISRSPKRKIYNTLMG